MLATTPPADHWFAHFPLWETYFALMAAGTAVSVLVSAPPAPRARMGALALLAAMAAWYLAMGRPLWRRSAPEWRTVAYLTGAFVLYVPAVALAPAISFLLFALCPQAFMLLPVVAATGTVLVLNAVHVVILLIRVGGVNSAVIATALYAAVMVIVVSVTGTWSHHVVAESSRRAALIRELDVSRGEVARLSHQAGIAAERQRLAGDIHDTVAQGLSSVVMLIQAAEADLDRDVALVRRHLGLAAATARDNLAEVRALVAALTPGELVDSPLAQALGRLVERFTAETGTPATMTDDGSGRPLPTPVEVVLLRVAQESLTNVRRHAGASRVAVRLAYRDDAVVLEVRDDGRGFAADDPPTTGYGLTGMRGRLGQVNGTLTVSSTAGAGTTIRAEVPVG